MAEVLKTDLDWLAASPDELFALGEKILRQLAEDPKTPAPARVRAAEGLLEIAGQRATTPKQAETLDDVAARLRTAIERLTRDRTLEDRRSAALQAIRRDLADGIITAADVRNVLRQPEDHSDQTAI